MTPKSVALGVNSVELKRHFVFNEFNSGKGTAIESFHPRSKARVGINDLMSQRKSKFIRFVLLRFGAANE